MSELFEKKPANWVKEYNFDHGVRVKVSDKGAFLLQTVLPSGETRHLGCFPKAMMEQIINASGDVLNILQSEEYAAIEANVATVKEQAKIERQKVTEAKKLMRKIESARTMAEIETNKALKQLETLGYSFTKKQA